MSVPFVGFCPFLFPSLYVSSLRRMVHADDLSPDDLEAFTAQEASPKEELSSSNVEFLTWSLTDISTG